MVSNDTEQQTHILKKKKKSSKLIFMKNLLKNHC